MAYRLINVTSSGQLSFKLLFADATEPKSISKEVLGLIFGSNYNFKAVVFHVRIGVGCCCVALGNRDNLGNAERIEKIILHYFLRDPRNPLFH